MYTNMASSEAQQEFDDLMRSKEHRRTHPEDDDNGSSTGDQAENEQPENSSEPSAASQASMTATRDMIPRTRYGANTGPKGVISDAQNYKESRRMHRSVRSPTSTDPPARELKFGQQQGIERLAELEEQGNLEVEDSDDLDDEFMAQWRQQRLQALQKGGYSSTMHDRSGSKRSYGHITTVDGEGYLEAIEKSGASTVVVVFISDDAVSCSRFVFRCLC